MASMRGLVEGAVVDALRPLLKQELGGDAGGYLHAVDLYNSELEGDDVPAIREALNGRAPAILVFSDSGRYRSVQEQRRRYVNDLSLVLLVVSNTARGRVAQTHGGPDGDDPGCYQIVEDTFDLLAGAQLGVDGLGRLMPTDEDILIQSEDMTIWRLRYLAPYDRTPRKRAEGVITSIRGRHNIPGVDAPKPVVEAITDLED